VIFSFDSTPYNMSNTERLGDQFYLLEDFMTRQEPLGAYASIADVQRHTSLSRPTIYRLIERGAFEAIKVGRNTRIVTASVEAYFASLPRLPTKAA